MRDNPAESDMNYEHTKEGKKADGHKKIEIFLERFKPTFEGFTRAPSL